MIEGESWLPEEIDKVNIARWKAQFVNAHTPLNEKDDEDLPDPVARIVTPKDFSIRRDHLEQHGYSEDCGRCRVLRRGGDGKGTHHTLACRERFRKIIRESEHPESVARADDRQNEFYANRIR